MKKPSQSLIVLVAFALGAGAASANSPTNSSPVSIDLSSSTCVTIVSLSSGPGVLHSISCKVTTAVTGYPTMAWWANVDGGSDIPFDDLYYAYGSTPGVFTTPFYYMSNGSGGTAMGDGLTFVMEKAYTSTLTVSVLASGATAGVIACIGTSN